MFKFRVLVIKVSKMVHFFLISNDGRKKSITLWAKYLSSSLRKCDEVLVSRLPFARCQHLKVQDCFVIFTLNISKKVTPKYIKHTIF